MTLRRAHRQHRLLRMLAVLIALNVAVFVVNCLFEMFPVLLLAVFGIALSVAHQRRDEHLPSPRVAELPAADVNLCQRCGGYGDTVYAGTDELLCWQCLDAARLRAENADLRARLADAQESAHAAWDAASSVTPRRPSDPSTARDKLLSDRLAGVHDLWGRS